MSLTVEDGTCVSGAESYVTVAEVTTYWGNRTQDAINALWVAATTAVKEGACREAAAYLDAVYGPFYKGQRQGYVQGLLWPRSNAKDEAGYPLPPIPDELKKAMCELAGRAITDRLAPDVAHSDAVKRVRKKVGPLETETEYVDGASTRTRYSVVDGLLALLLNSSPAGPSGGGSWNWL